MIVLARPVLVTTRVTYYRVDFPSLLNELVWQCDDQLPDLDRVRRFLDYWRREVRAVIATVEVAHAETRGDWRDARCLLEETT